MLIFDGSIQRKKQIIYLQIGNRLTAGFTEVNFCFCVKSWTTMKF